MKNVNNSISRRKLIKNTSLISASIITSRSLFAGSNPKITIVSPDRLKIKHFRNRAKEFKSIHSNINLEINVPDPTPDVQKTLVTSLSVGEKIADSTDFNSTFNWPAALIDGFNEEHFVDLTDRVKDLVATAVNWGPAMVDGKIWGFPDILASPVYYYREDIFNEANINPNFDTWEDLIEAGKKLKKDKGIYILPIDTSGYNHFQPLACMAGGGLYDESGNTLLDSDGSIKALELMYQLGSVHKIAYLTNQFYGAGTFQAYKNDEIAGAYMPTWYGTFHIPGKLGDMKGKWKVTSAPKFERNGWATTQRGGGIYPVIKGPHQEIVFEFLKYALLNPESQVKRLMEVDYYPNVKDSYNDERVKNKVHNYMGQKLSKVYGKIIKKSAPFYVGPTLAQTSDILARDVISNTVYGKIKAEDSLKKAAKKIRMFG